jgi:serine/threonine-protein kinase ATR
VSLFFVTFPSYFLLYLRNVSSTLEEQILEYKSMGNWTAAQSCYEIALQKAPDRLELHTGLLDCLKNLGLLETMLSHVKGTLVTFPKWSHTLNSYGIEACWRLGLWSSLKLFLSSAHDYRFEASIGQLLLDLNSNNLNQFRTNIKKARELLIPPFTAVSFSFTLRVKFLNFIIFITRHQWKVTFEHMSIS